MPAGRRLLAGTGCDSTRATIAACQRAADNGATHALVRPPTSYTRFMTQDVLMAHYERVADASPIPVLLYNQPQVFGAEIAASTVAILARHDNIVGMKDSHRTPLQFIQLCDITRGKMSVFVNQTQMFPYYQMGAAGCWSFNVWLGPSPVVRLREACFAQDWDNAKRICLDLDGINRVGPNIGNLSWRENVFKLAVNEAGYCTAGPLRAPWRIVPQEVKDNSKKIAAYWQTLCEKYPLMSEAARKSA